MSSGSERPWGTGVLSSASLLPVGLVYSQTHWLLAAETGRLLGMRYPAPVPPHVNPWWFSKICNSYKVWTHLYGNCPILSWDSIYEVDLVQQCLTSLRL